MFSAVREEGVGCAGVEEEDAELLVEVVGSTRGGSDAVCLSGLWMDGEG